MSDCLVTIAGTGVLRIMPSARMDWGNFNDPRELRQRTIELAGKSRSCFHVKITEPRVIQLWFDGKRRLVRQLSTEDGHPTELRLRSLRKLEADVTSDTKPAGE